MYDPVSILLVGSLAASVWLVWRTNKLFSKLAAVEMLVLVLAAWLWQAQSSGFHFGGKTPVLTQAPAPVASSGRAESRPP